MTRFAKHWERVCVETVESGATTKALAVLTGPKRPTLDTQDFLSEIDDNLRAAMV